MNLSQIGRGLFPYTKGATAVIPGHLPSVIPVTTGIHRQ